MGYCVKSDVEAIEAGRNIVFRDYSAGPPIVTATAPTATQVNGFIAQIYDEINQVILRAGYLIPLVANDYLKQVNAMGAAWMVELSIGIQGTAENMNVIKARENAYRYMLETIAKNARITGAFPSGGGIQPDAVSDGTSNWDNQDAPFKVSRKDW